MKHIMKLNPEPFEMIKSGRKTIELRQKEEKRQQIKSGDIIRFVRTDDENNVIEAEVIRLHLFDDFSKLYRELPLLKCGYTEENAAYADPKDMEIYYTPEKQKKYGVVGIEIRNIETDCLIS